MDLTWLRICAAGQTTGCVEPLQAAYLAVLVAGAVLFVYVARRSRDLSTAVLSLIPVAIAINVAVGSLTVALRLPLYLDSVGTVLVGVLAGPWAGALTGLLTDLVWSILPIPGGGGPSTAFFAPVAGVIGLMAGFWGSRGVFRLHPDDTGVGRLPRAGGRRGRRGRRVRCRRADDGPVLLRRRRGVAGTVRHALPRHRRDRGRRHLGGREDDLPVPAGRSTHPQLARRRDGALRRGHRLPRPAPALRAQGLLLHRDRPAGRRHAGPLPGGREPHRPGVGRTISGSTSRSRSGSRSGSAPGGGRRAARTRASSRSGSAASRPGWSGR